MIILSDRSTITIESSVKWLLGLCPETTKVDHKEAQNQVKQVPNYNGLKRANMLNKYQGKCYRVCIHHILEAPKQISESISSNIKDEQVDLLDKYLLQKRVWTAFHPDLKCILISGKAVFLQQFLSLYLHRPDSTRHINIQNLQFHYKRRKKTHIKILDSKLSIPLSNHSFFLVLRIFCI